jgi:hypothetical protein
MGTSANHPSPDTLPWHAVQAGYQNASIPVERVVKEIWRACQSDPDIIPERLVSPVLFECYQAIKSTTSMPEAVDRVANVIKESKSNSIIVELARRAVPPAFTQSQPAQAWLQRLYVQVTSYLVSRDLPGFISHGFRNENVKEAIEFKKSLMAKVSESVAQVGVEPTNYAEWATFVNATTAKLADR